MIDRWKNKNLYIDNHTIMFFGMNDYNYYNFYKFK